MNFDSLGELTCLHAVQIALLSAMVLAVVKLFAKDRPHLAHALWALVLLKCLMPPVIASPFSPFSWLGNAHNVASNNEGPVKTPPAQAESAPPATVRITYHPPAELAALVLPPAETLAARQTPKVSLWFILSTVWLVGTLLIGVMLYRRVAAYARLVRRKTIATPANLQELTNRLGQKLEVRRAVRVRVVDGPIGPAVVGILQPTLLLPECIVRSQSKLNLQPLIAHELVHVRRGDLWWSAVQTAASLVWWFHPCVWLASRLLTRETERSCDEETIANLGCRPADYARSLLDVLDKKSEIIAAPLVPGVRPIDITFKRMERIMRIGHGSHPRTPRWVIALLLIGATLALPGARWLDAQEGDTNLKEKPAEVQSSPGKRLPRAPGLKNEPASPAQPAPKLDITSPAYEGMDVVILDIQILDVPTELVKELITKSPRKSDIQQVTAAQLGDPIPIRLSQRGVGGQVLLSGLEDDDEISSNLGVVGYLVIHEDHASGNSEAVTTASAVRSPDVVTASESAVAGPINQLDAFRHGDDKGKASTYQSLDGSTKWALKKPALLATHAKDVTTASGESSVPHYTGLQSVLNAEQLATIDGWLASKGQSKVNRLNAPRIATYSGVRATCTIGQQRPIVGAMEGPQNKQPSIQVVQTGLTCEFTPTVDGPDGLTVEVLCNLSQTEIAGVQEIEKTTDDGSTVTLQHPTVNKQEVTFGINVPKGGTFAATLGTKQTDAGETTTLYVVTVNQLAQPEPSSGQADAIPGESQAEAAHEGAATSRPELDWRSSATVACEEMQREMEKAIASIEAANDEIRTLTTALRLSGESARQSHSNSEEAKLATRENRVAGVEDALPEFDRQLANLRVPERERKGTNITAITTAELKREAELACRRWEAGWDKPRKPSAGSTKDRKTNSDERISIMGPVVSPAERKRMLTRSLASPSDSEILQAIENGLEESRSEKIAALESPRIIKEAIADYIYPTQLIQKIGRVKLHHRHYKCTIYATGEGKEVVDVVYIDHNHFIMVESL